MSGRATVVTMRVVVTMLVVVTMQLAKRSLHRRGRGVRGLRAGGPVGGRVLTLVRALGGRALTLAHAPAVGIRTSARSGSGRTTTSPSSRSVTRKGAVPDRTSARSVHRRTSLLRLHLFWLHPHNTSTSKQIYKIIITSINNITNNTGIDMLLFCQAV